MVEVTEYNDGTFVHYTIMGTPNEVTEKAAEIERSWPGYMAKCAGVYTDPNGKSTAVVTRWTTCN